MNELSKIRVFNLQQAGRRAVREAERLRHQLDVVDRQCLETYERIHEEVSKAGGSAADHRAANEGIGWNFEAMRATRRKAQP